MDDNFRTYCERKIKNAQNRRRANLNKMWATTPWRRDRYQVKANDAMAEVSRYRSALSVMTEFEREGN